MNRRQFLAIGGIASASLVLGACAPARAIVQQARGNDGALLLPTRVTDETWHALSRMTFAPRADELVRAKELGLDAWTEEQLAPETLDDWDCELRTRGLDTLWMEPDLILNVRQDAAKQELQQATLLRAVYSRRQLYETVVEFWSDHFNIAQDKFDCAWLKTVDEREVIRKHAFGNFYEMLWASMRSPAMLHYLDNHENFSHAPNENYARELLELHSLGVEAGYTQRDVRETARALTGWTVNQSWRRGRFEFDAGIHDNAEKIVLGVHLPAHGGESDGQRVFDALGAHPALPKFIARKLARRFVADEPPASLVEKTARAFSESRGDIKTTLRAMLFSDEFRSAPPKYKRPLQLVAGALRQLKVETNARAALLRHLAKMGQPLHQWDMPDGFPDRAEAWQNNLLARWQFALALASDEIQGTRVNWAQLQNIAGDGSLRDALRNFSLLLLGAELPKTNLDTLAEMFRRVPQEKNVPFALAVLIASPQYQWR